jgi:hypothetical protein
MRTKKKWTDAKLYYKACRWMGLYDFGPDHTLDVCGSSLGSSIRAERWVYHVWISRCNESVVITEKGQVLALTMRIPSHENFGSQR